MKTLFKKSPALRDKTKLLGMLLLVFMLPALHSGCFQNYYKSRTVAAAKTNASSKITILTMLKQQNKYIILHQGPKVWHVKGSEVDTVHQTISCSLSEVPVMYMFYLERMNKSYSKPTYKPSEREYAINQAHIYIAESEEHDETSITFPISSIHQVDVYGPAAGATLASYTFSMAPIIGIGALVIACNCPYVKVLGKDSTQFQGSLFPGAISHSLERADRLIMKDVPFTKEGQVKVEISNELPETEYFGQVELFEINKMQHSSLALDEKGELIAYNMEDHLLAARTPLGENLREQLRSQQGEQYDFSEEGNDSELNKVFLTFKKEGLKDKSLLVIRAKQSKWMEKVAEYFFQRFGTAFPKWIEHLDKTNPKKFAQDAIARGISMNAYVKINNQWEYLGSYSNAGTLEHRNLVLRLDLEMIKSETIEIKLEAAHNLWDIDYAGISDDWSADVKQTKLKTISAVNQDGKDVSTALAADDADYMQQPRQGDHTVLLFEAPSDTRSFLVLKAKGYYHHQRSYTNKPEYKTLRAFDKDKLSTHQLSRVLSSYAMAEANKKAKR